MTESRTMTVAAAQIRSTADREDNLRQVRESVARAADQGAALVVLPEGTSFWFGDDVRPAAEDLDGPTATALRRLAEQHEVTVVAGLFEPADEDRVYNTLLLTGPAGEATYRKVHLFDALGTTESKTVAPGDEYVVTPVADGHGGTVQVGLATCFDVRFAEQFTALGTKGAEIVVLPTSWGSGEGKARQWEVLTRARAMDAQAWLVACGQAYQGELEVPVGIGRSAIIGPLGAVAGELGGDPDVLVREIDLAEVEQAREIVPVLRLQRC